MSDVTLDLKEESEEEKILNAFQTAKDKAILPEFYPGLVSFDSLRKKLAAQESNYLEDIMSCIEEAKLADENTADLKALPREVMVSAIKIAMEIESRGDPDYFTKNKIEGKLIKPVMQVRAVFAKASETERLRWNVEYRARLIHRLKDYLHIKSQSEDEKLSLLERIKVLFTGII